MVAALKSLAGQVQAEEPDTWMYVVHDALDEGSIPPPALGEIVFVEAYKDHAAFVAHVTGKPFLAFMAEFGPLLVQQLPPNKGGYIQVDALDRIGGFVRPQAAA